MSRYPDDLVGLVFIPDILIFQHCEHVSFSFLTALVFFMLSFSKFIFLKKKFLLYLPFCEAKFFWFFFLKRRSAVYLLSTKRVKIALVLHFVFLIHSYKIEKYFINFK